jgi:hypothetical protein
MKQMTIGDSPMSDSTKYVIPNFLIIGASRSGTSSLHYWLRQHPEVFMPDMKEPSFHVNGWGIADWHRYLLLFEPGRGKKAIGEASVAYLESPESPLLIKERVPDTKIIILLRNPVDRALSLYSWMVMHGHEWHKTFEQAIAGEKKRFDDESFRRKNPVYFWSYMYFRNGLYYEQVKRYIDTFGRELVKVCLFKDLVGSPNEVYGNVCEFLEISTAFHPIFVPQNPSQIPRSIILQYLLSRCHKSSHRFPGVLGTVVRQIVALAMSSNRRLGHKPKMSKELRKKLQEMYRPDIARLSELVQRDLCGSLSGDN